jgi:hypothetical protein
MVSNPQNRPDSFSSARGLSFAGLVLGGLYLAIVAGAFFPVQLLNPAWQLAFGSALINASPFPLIGLGALHLARALDPADPLLQRRSRLGARLAVAVALGFLLLIPLLSLAAIQQQQQRASSQSSSIRRAESNLQALRQVVATAANSQELHDRLLALNGPVLNEADKALPLATIKAQVNGLLDQAAAQVVRQKQQLPPSNPWTLLPEILRNAFASLLLALGFAGLAQRPNRRLSLLQELQQGWDWLRYRNWSLRRASGPGGADPDYFQLLSQQAEAEENESGGRS